MKTNTLHYFGCPFKPMCPMNTYDMGLESDGAGQLKNEILNKVT